MSEHTPFLAIFPCCEQYCASCGGLEKAHVTDVKIYAASGEMVISARFPAMPSPTEELNICGVISAEYALKSVKLHADYPREAVSDNPTASQGKSAVTGNVLLGKAIKKEPVPMSTVQLESGNVAVEGDVVAVTSKTTKSGGAVLCFDLTDKTNTLRVSKFLRPEDDKSVIAAIDKGNHLVVQGTMVLSKFEGDVVLEPRNIVAAKKTVRPDNAPEKRVELHLHTRFSNMDALTDPTAVVKRAAYWGMPAIAVTDHGVAQAFPEMWKAGKANGVKIIFGLEAYYFDDSEGSEDANHQRTGKEGRRTHHMILLVKNKVGLKHLYKLISESYLTYFHRSPNVPKSLLDQHREGILVGSACAMGELYEAVIRKEPDEKLEKIASYYDFLEIQPVPNNGFLLDSGKVKDVSEIMDFNRKIYRLGQKLGKPVVAASDVHFMDPEDEQLRKILLVKYADSDKDCPIYFRNTEEMLAEFDYLGKEIAEEIVIKNTRAIADQIETFDLLPKELFPPKIENSAGQLRDLVYGKMHRIYGQNPPEIVLNRVETELKTILDHNYDVIYMSAQKLVQDSLEHGYLVGSRGSVGSSMVAYMSGITEVNSLPPHYVCPKCCHSEFVTDGSYGCGADMPEKNCPECGTLMRQDGFDIPFETFLGFPGNEKTPDIDLNFSGEYQAKAHKYTETLFGSDHVFRAGTYGLLAEKTAYGYVLKYLEQHGLKVSKAEENRLALGLVGVRRTTGQHPGGLVVIPQDMDVTDFCPVQHPADDPTSDIITTHFEYHCMEDNLLKLDELGHDDPTMIKMLEDATGVDAKKILFNDPDTMAIFTTPSVLGLPEDDPIIGQTGTIGIPEFGTGFTRQMLVETQPKQFDTLVRLSGFSHGTDVWAGNIRDLIVNKIATVNETVGCRDDIMLTLIAKGMEPSLAFKTMEAVRKGKVHKTGSFPGDAEEQMRALGVPDWYIESCRKIQYLFPKAHAVAYVMMAFRIAWFKVHRPLAFYSAYFYRRSQKGGFDAERMSGGADSVRRKINDMRKRQDLTANEEDLLVTMEAVYEFNMRGFEFLPVDLYQSDASKFIIEGDKCLRLPFVSVSGLGENAAIDLAACGASGKRYISVEELGAECPKVSQTCLDTLKKMGSLGDMPDSSQISFFDF